MKKHIFFCLLIFVVLGCKKDRLKNQYDVFIGNWEFKYVIHTYSSYDQVTGQNIYYTDTVYSDLNNYSLLFEKKGKLTKTTNNTIIDKHRIVFNLFRKSENCSETLESANLFEIHLDNKEDNPMIGCILNDTLTCANYLHIEEFLEYPSEDSFEFVYVKN